MSFFDPTRFAEEWAVYEQMNALSHSVYSAEVSNHGGSFVMPHRCNRPQCAGANSRYRRMQKAAKEAA
jgi:hypothetical protein